MYNHLTSIESPIIAISQTHAKNNFVVVEPTLKKNSAKAKIVTNRKIIKNRSSQVDLVDVSFFSSDSNSLNFF